MKNMKKRIILFGISFSLIAGLIYFSNPFKVANILTKANPTFIAIGLFLWLLSCLARSFRWNYLLEKVDIDLPFHKIIKYYVTGLFISNFSPGKTADPIRAVFLKKAEGESFSKSLGSIFIERIFDIIVMFSIAVIGLFWLTASYNIVKWVALAIGIYLFLIAFSIYLIFSEDKLERFLNKIISIFSFVPKIEKFGGRVEDFSRKLRNSLKIYKSKKTLFTTFLLSIPVWILGGLIGWVAFLALGFDISPLVVLTVKISTILISYLTLLPGSLGSGEIIGVSLYSLFGVGIPVAGLTSRVIIGRLMNFWMYVLVGAILLTTFKEKTISL